MGLTTALYTALSGLETNSHLLGVAGNNIANVNTHGFKSSRMTFETQISRNLSPASAPTDDFGGSNPTQIGLGVRPGAINRNFNSGSLQPTGVDTDMAIDGSGFFIVDIDGVQRYSRAGTFTLNSNFNLINPDGGRVQGYGVDEELNVIEGVLQDVRIPLGVLSMAQSTETVQFAGNLNAGGDVATVGSIVTSNPLYSDATQTTQATAMDDLDQLFNRAGVALFSVGDVITVTGVAKGGETLADKTFEIGSLNPTNSDGFGTTLGHFLNFMDDILGLDSDADSDAGATVNAAGKIVIRGNTGTANSISLDTGNVVVNQATTPTMLPFGWADTQVANGESVRTSFAAFDSLGSQLRVDLSIVLENKDNTGTAWRYYIQSEDDSGLDRALQTGTITYDTDGQFTSISDSTFTINRDNSGAVTPQSIEISFVNPEGTLSALESTSSVVNTLSQDGFPIGSLESFSVGKDGTIVGGFSNSMLHNLGRIALANFANPQGLAEIGANLYSRTPNSGDAQIVNPGTSGAGQIVGAALELSNVELSQEFINLITATTGFSASSRVVSTSDRLIQELLSTVR